MSKYKGITESFPRQPRFLPRILHSREQQENLMIRKILGNVFLTDLLLRLHRQSKHFIKEIASSYAEQNRKEVDVW